MAVRRGLTRFARPSGSLFAALSVCPTGYASSRTPVRASHPRQAVQHAKKKPVLAYELFFKYGGEAGIDSLRSPCGQIPRRLVICPNAGAFVEPRSGLLIPARLYDMRKKSPYLRTSSSLNMAVRRGFEPRIRCRIHTFQACSFSHSDTSPYCCSCATGTGANVGETPPRRQSTF